MINAIIMASGSGRRMGENKLLLKYNGKTFIENIMDKVSECEFINMVAVAKDDSILKMAEDKGFIAVKNNNHHLGQSESIKLGILNSPKADGYMFFTADQPLLDIDTIKSLMEAFEKNNSNITVPVYNGKRGNPVIFPSKYLNELLSLEGDTGGRLIINNHIENVDNVDIINGYALVDVDTIEDYEKIILACLNE